VPGGCVFRAAVVATCIPLINSSGRPCDAGTPSKLPLSAPPSLANMMEDPLLRERCVRHLDLSLRLAERECERTKDWPDVHFLSWMYRQLLAASRQTFGECCGSRLCNAFHEYASCRPLESVSVGVTV